MDFRFFDTIKIDEILQFPIETVSLNFYTQVICILYDPVGRTKEWVGQKSG